ncbi:MAG TPA: Ig-like domain-containing protein [Gemmatimonadaceae bacterium]|nr:Ig-like domain-containing protein [Gemmatimonadaceae bacterium]
MLGFLSCSENSVTGSDGLSTNDLSADANRVASVSVALANDTIQVGGTTQARATLRDYQNRLISRTVTWTSSNTAVATVDTTGLVSGIAEGSAVITATRGYKSGSATLVVVAAIGFASGTPGTVTDLAVAAVDSTSTTLAFTQVSDGAGQPAKYDVRYSVGSISWGSARSVTNGTCSTPVAGTSVAAKLTCTVTGLAPSTGYNFQLIAYRGTLNQDAVFGSLSNAVAVTTTASGSPPPPPPPPSTGYDNEPAGMTLISDRPFNSKTEDPLWDNYNAGPLTINQDPTAPKSPTSVIRATFPAGFQGGNSNGATGIPFSGVATLYISYWAKYSTNWQGNPTDINKQGYAWVDENGGSPKFVMEASGVGSGPMQPRPILQNMISGDGHMDPNLVPNQQIVRGQWFHIEIVLRGNSAGTANGSFDLWQDGVHCTSYSGLQWTSAATRWSVWELYPVWGGVGGTVTSTMWIQWDHIRLSGKN